jgi:hypothetical protein
MSRRSTSVPRGTPLKASVRLLALAAMAICCLAHAGAGRAATVGCPATFQVEHDDRIGSLSLPAGAYRIRATGVSCAAASQLFTQFLNDWDGRLPGSWRTGVQGVGRGTFTGPGGQAFTVQRGGGGAAGGGLVCSQRFVLTQNDRIGALVIKQGRYIIDRLGPLSPSCAQAVSLLGGFLTDFDGVLSNGWVLLANDATFVRGSVSYGFRLEPDPDQGRGGNRFPTQTTRCAATFRVVHDDRIGALAFPAGPYWVSIYKGSNITCPQATQLFATFLQRTDGRLPSPYGFLAKPAFNAT